jgi:hypothetical protein
MLSCAALLVVSGVPKLANPHATIAALRSVGARWVGPITVRSLTAIEIGAGLSAITVGGRWADGAVGLLYLGFTAFLIRALRTPTASCGCTGRDDTPPTAAHLVMTATFSAAACAAVATGARTGVVSLARTTQAGELAVALGLAVIVTWLGWSILTLSRRVPSPRAT